MTHNCQRLHKVEGANVPSLPDPAAPPSPQHLKDSNSTPVQDMPKICNVPSLPAPAAPHLLSI